MSFNKINYFRFPVNPEEQSDQRSQNVDTSSKKSDENPVKGNWYAILSFPYCTQCYFCKEKLM